MTALSMMESERIIGCTHLIDDKSATHKKITLPDNTSIVFCETCFQYLVGYVVHIVSGARKLENIDA